MNVLWPWALTLLLIVPLMVAFYIWILRRKRRYTVRFSSIALIRAALPRNSRWRRHIPFIAFMLGIAALLTAMSRPVAEITVPMSRATIMLAIDVSRSMCATDVEPNRLTVAQEAARAFIEDQAEGTQIGIVAFTGLAEIVVPPTNDKEALTEAVDGFTTAFGTAIGSAILKSIDAIAEINENVAPSGVNLRAGIEDGASNAEEPGADEDVTRLYEPDIIVLLTDGANSQGPLPLQAAEQAVDRKVRVYTIGFGTTDPGDLICSSEQMGSEVFRRGSPFPGGFEPGGGGGFRRFIVLDEPTLRGVAEMTGGEYFQAENAEQLLDVFLNLPSYVILQTEQREISALFSAIGALFAAVGIALSLRWNRFP